MRMLKWLFFNLVIVSIRYASSSCNVDVFGHHLFGTDCNYLCHCANGGQCDYVTGECEAGCADHWMGPGCQYRDIARGKTAKQLNTLPDKYATLAVDGNMNTCSETNVSDTESTRHTNPFWRLLLGNVEAIRGLQITPTQDTLGYFESGFNITVENITSSDNDIDMFYPDASFLCYVHSSNTSLQSTFEVMCDKYIFGNQIRIQLDNGITQLGLCDVKVYGGRNVAFKQNGSQSSENLSNLYASIALDGNLVISQSTCSSTDLTKFHWWRVDFKQVLFVHSINIIKLNNDRIRNYYLQSLDEVKKQWDIIYQDRGSAVTYLHFVSHTRSMRIYRSYREKLRLCEVQLFGDCPEYKCGLDCSIECHCKKHNYLEQVSGNCTHQCLGRWWGNDSKCDTECPSTKWGQECTEICGHCSANEPCEMVNGFCINGCADGYKASNTCSEECEKGTFGQNCMNACNSTCANSCNVVDGTCTGVCIAGWSGIFCEKGCDNGTFGENCTGVCNSTCFDGCNTINGMCKEGCASDWGGDYCESECPDGTWGRNCNMTCGNCEDYQCDVVNGTCPGPCKPGSNHTSFCETVLEKHNGSSSTPVIVGTTIGVVVTLCTAVLFIQFLNRRNLFNGLLQHKVINQQVEWSKESEVSPYVNISHISPNGSKGITADKVAINRVDLEDNYQTLIISSPNEGHYSTLKLSG